MAQDDIFRDLEKRYGKRINELLGEKQLQTEDFRQFVAEERSFFQVKTWYEAACRLSGKVLPFLKPGAKLDERMNEDIIVAGVNCTPPGVLALALLFFAVTSALSIFLWTAGIKDLAFFAITSGFIISLLLARYPNFLAQIAKIRSHQESILAVLYMTIYLKSSPVLESAVRFTAVHLNGPLGRDMKQIIWLIESHKYARIEDAVSYFIPLWSKRNPDFLKAMVTLYQITEQADEAGMDKVLNKALDTILQDTYEKMQHYSYDLKLPLVMLETFGLMLPLLGLVAFPLISVFLSEEVNMSYVFFGYVVILPAIIFVLSQRILAKRPGAFSAPDIEQAEGLPKKGNAVLFGRELPVLPIALCIGLFIMIPGLLHLFTITLPAYDYAKSSGATISNLPEAVEREYGILALLTVATIPLGLALGLIVYFYLTSKDRLRLRDEVQEIEEDSDETIFAMTSQFTENIPIEVAINKIIAEYEVLRIQRRKSYDFYSAIRERMQLYGRSFEQALFERPGGVLSRYPSILMREIFWVLSETSKKGSAVLYNVGGKISVYLSNVKRIKELIYVLLNETVSSINLQARFLAPFIAGIVSSITIIIIRALASMGKAFSEIMSAFSFSGSSGPNVFDQIFDFSNIIPPTLFAVLIGIYVVETTVLLSIMSSGVEYGFDNVKTRHTIGKNLLFSIAIYLTVTLIGVFVLNIFLVRGSQLGA
ncbi:hypothetical protein HYY74_03165 [Candidatus Woesearchaeota archaeon]|nr:hypothetical protein [Candidatus Woesearchaeota archaeon]